jgi:hypothetical protein
MILKTQAATELARFLAHRPIPEQIASIHPSSEVSVRAYQLIQTEREGVLAVEERARARELCGHGVSDGTGQTRSPATVEIVRHGC